MRVLDLYAGLGGTDKGIRKVAAEKKLKIDYYAIEINPAVCQAHKKNNPETNIICADVKDWLDKITEFVISNRPFVEWNIYNQFDSKLDSFLDFSGVESET